jgi:uncharacterized protein (TIGR02246 family)
MHTPARGSPIDEPATTIQDAGEENPMLTIAGVTGRIGGAVAEALLMRGTKLRVLVRTAHAAQRWRNRGAEVAIVDLQDELALTRALQGSDGMFALLPEDLSVPDFRAHRRRMAEALAASVRSARVPHVVFLSSLAAAAPAGPARDLRDAEDLLSETACKLTVLRAAFFQDNLAAAIPVARQHGMFASLFASDSTPIPMVATDDVAGLVTACLVHPSERSEIVDVLGPAYSSAEVVEHLAQAFGKRLDLVTIPPLAQVDFLRRIGVPPQFAASLVELYACLGSQQPARHDRRVVTGTTTLPQTLSRLTRPPPRSERASIHAVVAALTDAWNRHDLAAMGELYRADADFVNIFGGYLRGRDEIVGEHVERHKVMFACARMANTAPVVRTVSPTVALARVAWTMRGITAMDGKPAPDREGLMLHVLERIAGEWFIVTTQNTELAHGAPRRFLDLLAAAS